MHGKLIFSMQGVLRDINISIFKDINSWVQNSFKAVRSCGEPGFAEATQPYPIALDASSKQIFTGLVYTSNTSFTSLYSCLHHNPYRKSAFLYFWHPFDVLIHLRMSYCNT